MNNKSRLEILREKLSKEEFTKFVGALSETEQIELFYSIKNVGRPKQQPPSPDQRFVMYCCGRGFGKAIQVSKPIYTINRGWTTNGDLVEGDILFGLSGPTTILKAHTPYIPDEAYRIHFDNGETIDACPEHLWTTINGYKFNKYKVSTGGDYKQGLATHTTAELFKTQKYKNRYANHKIPVIEKYDLPEQNLPIDPYVFGYWLGDGGSNGYGMTIGDEDAEWTLSEFERLGHPLRTLNGSLAYSFITEEGGTPVISLLRELGVRNNKHIPLIYQTSSREQRLALLQGLMDSDGHTQLVQNNRNEIKTIAAEIGQKNLTLATDIHLLVSGLGIKSKISTIKSSINGKVCAPSNRVTFRNARVPYHRMPRKLAKIQKEQRPNDWRQNFVSITKIEKVQPTPMRCLTVDSTDRLYGVGQTLTLTHNTFTGSHLVHHWAETYPGCRIAIVGGSFTNDVKETMCLGTSGILATASPNFMPKFNKSEARFEYPNGSTVVSFTGEKPENLRGPNNQFILIDELAKMPYAEDVWKQALFTNRGPEKVKQIVITTTPRNTALMRKILADERFEIITGSSKENTSLTTDDLEVLYDEFGGTRLGRQELEGELLTDNPNSLFSFDDIAATRINPADLNEELLVDIVVAVDPAVSANERSDSHGIMVVGKDAAGNGYVLKDGTVKGSTNACAKRAVALYESYNASAIVVEVNNGGDWIPDALKAEDPLVRVKKVHATKGKALRAEPVSMLYEQRKVHHVGEHQELETQMTDFDPTQTSQKSPDRLDALVWALTYLCVKKKKKFKMWSIS